MRQTTETLIRTIAEHDRWTAEEIDLALAAAKEDPAGALQCWRSIAEIYGIADLTQQRSTT